METTSSTAAPLTDEWCAHQFDYLAPEFGVDPHEPLARMRSKCPVTHSDLYGGYWVLSRYDDVAAVFGDPRCSSAKVADMEARAGAPARRQHNCESR